MKPRLRILLAILEAAFVLIAVYFEPSYGVRGKLHGEAFFEGKSTSWWRRELEQWEVAYMAWGNWPVPIYRRNPTWFDRFKDGARQFWKELPVALYQRNPVRQPEAEPVLRELLDDASPKVRRFARIGLNMPREPE